MLGLEWEEGWILRFDVMRLQLAGVVAVEVTGGPTIPFHPGRKVRAWLGIRGEVRVLVVAPECGIREAVML